MSQRLTLAGTLSSTLRVHKTWMVALCSYEHISVPLCAVHYATWSILVTGIYTALTYFTPSAAYVLAVLLAGWSIVLDPYVGAFYATLTAVYIHAAHVAVSDWGFTPLFALGLGASALAFEAYLHTVLQGPTPGPPPKTDGKDMPAYIIVPYFVMTMGIFFLTLTLVMRFTGYEREIWAAAKKQTNIWHTIEMKETKVEAHKRFHAEVMRRGL
ncbi:hypothetical protein HK101_002241 [Irineochytrium annulatum]|nr:hypothetical protein HK101_002241 [Irineochytrium annulatum]